MNWKPWANVRVAGHKEFTTPANITNLKPGSYKVILTNPDLGQTTRTVTVQAGRETVLAGEFEEPGTLNLNSIPWANVIVNGEDRGATPLSLSLSPGHYTIVLLRTGDPTQSATYEVAIESDKSEKISHRF